MTGNLGKAFKKIERMENHQSIKHALEALITATKNIENETRVLELGLEEFTIWTIELQKTWTYFVWRTLPIHFPQKHQYLDESLIQDDCIGQGKWQATVLAIC